MAPKASKAKQNKVKGEKKKKEEKGIFNSSIHHHCLFSLMKYICSSSSEKSS